MDYGKQILLTIYSVIVSIIPHEISQGVSDSLAIKVWNIWKNTNNNQCFQIRNSIKNTVCNPIDACVFWFGLLNLLWCRKLPNVA